MVWGGIINLSKDLYNYFPVVKIFREGLLVLSPPNKEIPMEFKIRLKYTGLYIVFHQSDHKEILHIPSNVQNFFVIQ